MKRLKDNYYSEIQDFNVLTDEEFNELVHIEQVFDILSLAIPEDKTSDLSEYISTYLIERNNRSLELCGIAYDRVNGIINLCKNGY